MHGPIYDQLLFFSDHLKHYRDDLVVHDYAILHNPSKCPDGSSWLWIVHKAGTHLCRWDSDPYAGTRDSLPELLIRNAIRGSWPSHRAHIFHVDGFCPTIGALGIVTGSLSVDDLEQALPRPKPEPTLPGHRPTVSASAAAEFAQLCSQSVWPPLQNRSFIASLLFFPTTQKKSGRSDQLQKMQWTRSPTMLLTFFATVTSQLNPSL